MLIRGLVCSRWYRLVLAECWTPRRSKFLCCLSFSPAFLLSTSSSFLLMLAVTVNDYYQSKVFQQTTVCLGHYQNSTDCSMLEHLSWDAGRPRPRYRQNSNISKELSFCTWHELPGSYMTKVTSNFTNPHMRSTLTWHKSKQFPKVPFAQNPRFHHMNADI